ncbi:MAG: hypothetical protein IJN37_07390 [Clostridia bacterium]|nr:hypothetical protein [Clostridia bacterium]
MKLIKQVFGDNHFVKIFYNVFVAHCTSPSSNSYLSFSSLYHIFLFTSMLGEIAGVGAHQSKSKKGKVFSAAFMFSVLQSKALIHISRSFTAPHPFPFPAI